MKESKRPLMPRKKAEHLATMAAALLVLFGGLLAVGALRKNVTNASSPTEEVPPSPGPLAGLTVLVDAGHGGYDGGARCRDSGVWEKVLTLAVAAEVEQALAGRGAQVVMTRTEDTDLCTGDRPANLTKKRQDMQNRIALAKEHGAGMVLSIHMNEYRVRSESGPQVFYRAGNDGGRLLAGCVQESLITHLQPKKQRTAMAGDYFILQLEVPSVLVECGFISNPAEEKLLLDPAYQAKIAEAIADGVEEFVRLTNQSSGSSSSSLSSASASSV
nr:N-acetylmuramoyl-L-alanine amidase [Clostridia bacterium]